MRHFFAKESYNSFKKNSKPSIKAQIKYSLKSFFTKEFLRLCFADGGFFQYLPMFIKIYKEHCRK